MKKTALFLTLIFLTIFLSGQSESEYLESVLNDLKQIKSACYASVGSGYAPGDTSAYGVYKSFYKAYSNPKDTFVGASFVKLQQADTTKMEYYYDGMSRARVDWDEKTMEIDSFQNNPWAFRAVKAPFFTRVARLIKYTLETEDSIDIGSKDLGDSLQLSIIIYDQVVEVIGNRIVYGNRQFSILDEISRYDIWINKSDGLPYRIKRDMPHDISIETVHNVQLNKNLTEVFKASKYLPAGFPVSNRGKRKPVKSILEGKPAPEWILEDANGSTLTLAGLKSKVLLIEFTSVSCGPCREAIPFLKKLSSEYDKKDFDFVSIEGFNRNSTVLKKYQERNDFDYKFLMSTKEVTKSYGVRAIPVFFILDENRVIRKVVRGYGKGTTDEEIRGAINGLI